MNKLVFQLIHSGSVPSDMEGQRVLNRLFHGNDMEIDLNAETSAKTFDLKKPHESNIQDTEEFVGLDGDKLGPFKKGDVVNLPTEIANILIVDSKAELMEDDE